MIITCEECTTRFKLDDARIPEGGAKVRCSKCKYAFFVKLPSSAGDPVENVVDQALDNEDTESEELASSGSDDPGASASSDLTSPGDSAAALRTPDVQSAQSAMDDFEESDWEFNTDEAAAAEEELDGFQEPPGLAGEEEAEDTSELGLDEAGATTSELDESGLDLEADTGALDLAGDSSAADLAGDSSAADLAGDSSTADLAGDSSAADLAGDSSAADLEGDTPALGREASDLETEPHVSVDAASEAVDDLLGGVDDDEEEEELFDTSPGAVERGIDDLLDDSDDAPGIDSLLDDAPEGEIGAGPELGMAPDMPSQDPIGEALDDLGLDSEAAAAPAVSAPPSAAPEISTPPPAAAAPEISTPPAPAASEAPAPIAEELGEPGEWDIFGEEPGTERAPSPVATQPLVIGRIGESSADARPPVQVNPEPAASGVWGRRVAHGVGWSAVCALSVLILYQALWVAPRVAPVVSTSQQLAGLEATSIEGRWVENSAGGSLYVISGKLAGADRPLTPGSRLAVRLLGASGRPLLDEAADVGPALPMRALREESPEALRASQADAAHSLAWQPFFPAQALRVAAVLEEMPPAARRFELMAVPVAKPVIEPPAAAEAGEPLAPTGAQSAVGEPAKAPMGAPAEPA